MMLRRTGHRARREGEPDRPEQGMAHPRASDLAARRGRPAGRRVPGPDGTVDEKGSLGEASASCGAGAGEGIRAGTVSWTTLTLAPGRYELICNLPNHYADGMYQELQVTSA